MGGAGQVVTPRRGGRSMRAGLGDLVRGAITRRHHDPEVVTMRASSVTSTPSHHIGRQKKA